MTAWLGDSAMDRVLAYTQLSLDLQHHMVPQASSGVTLSTEPGKLLERT